MRRSGSFRLLLVSMPVALFAFTSASASAASANLSHSYHALGSIPNGSLVSLDSQQPNYVEMANTYNSVGLIGVSVPVNDSLLAVDQSTNPGDVQVATAGSASILVSTLNGDVHVGDQIGVSPFNGVGIEALPDSRVIGLAETAFTAQTAGATSEQVTDKSGKASTITVGYAEVSIAIGSNATGAGVNINALQRVAKNLTGHVVSTFRIIIGLSVAVIASLALITLIYASIYGSIISIGRNPLAKYAVFRTLGSVLGLALLTAVIAGLTIFLLLD